MRLLATVMALAVSLPAVAHAQAERMSDKDVKALMDTIHDRRDRFEDALDGEFKHSVLRGPSGEVDVEHFLDDFQNNVLTMRDRYRSDYAASQEVTTVLGQGSAIERHMRQQGAGMKGTSEWDATAADLKRLAAAYSTTFPLPEGAAARRLGDKEVAAAAEMISSQAGQLETDIERGAKTLPEADRAEATSMAHVADALSKDAKELKKRVSDGKPSSAQARAVIDAANKLDGYLAGKSLGAANSTMAEIKGSLNKISQGFGM